jgi:hypothetical protein
VADRPVLAVAVPSVAVGISAFGVTVIIGDVAADLGQPSASDDTSFQLGLTLTASRLHRQGFGGMWPWSRWRSTRSPR